MDDLHFGCTCIMIYVHELKIKRLKSKFECRPVSSCSRSQYRGTVHLCPGSILLAKICWQIVFAIVAKGIIEKKLCQKITNKYRKNRRNNKSNKKQEGPRNVRKYRKNRKSNMDFSCQLKTPVTNIAKIATIRNLTRIKTWKQKKPRGAPKCLQKSQMRQASKNFYNKCSKNSISQIVFRTDIFQKLPLVAPESLLSAFNILVGVLRSGFFLAILPLPSVIFLHFDADSV